MELAESLLCVFKKALDLSMPLPELWVASGETAASTEPQDCLGSWGGIDGGAWILLLALSTETTLDKA